MKSNIKLTDKNRPSGLGWQYPFSLSPQKPNQLHWCSVRTTSTILRPPQKPNTPQFPHRQPRSPQPDPQSQRRKEADPEHAQCPLRGVTPESGRSAGLWSSAAGTPMAVPAKRRFPRSRISSCRPNEGGREPAEWMGWGAERGAERGAGSRLPVRRRMLGFELSVS